MPAFKTKKIKFRENFGKVLKKARLRKGLTLGEIEKATQIKKSHLHAIEEEKFEILPSEAYTFGFLRTYSAILGIDKKEATASFKKDHIEFKSLNGNEKKKFGKKDEIFPEEVTLNRFSITPRFITVAVVLLVGLFLALYLFRQVSGFASAPKLEIVTPEELEFITDNKRLTFSGRTDSSARLSISGQEIPTSENGNFSQELSLNKGVNIIEVEAKNKSDKTTSKVLKIIVN